MNYTFSANTGIVTREDGVIVAPAQSADDPLFVEYNEWIMAGNEPIVSYESVPIVKPDALVVTPRQIRLALSKTGLRAMVEGAVAAGSQDLKDTWEFSNECNRYEPMVVMMGAALGKTEAEMDALFNLAASL